MAPRPQPRPAGNKGKLYEENFCTCTLKVAQLRKSELNDYNEKTKEVTFILLKNKLSVL